VFGSTAEELSFTPYPGRSPYSPPPSILDYPSWSLAEGFVAPPFHRIFIGQVPSDHSVDLQWVLATFCLDVDPSATLFNFSPHVAGPYRTFNGCAHALLWTADVDAVLERLHKRLLFDQGGVWYASTDAAAAFLGSYCEREWHFMDCAKRHQLLPHLPCRPLTFEVSHQATAPGYMTVPAYFFVPPWSRLQVC
jgi:hypothetical protein